MHGRSRLFAFVVLLLAAVSVPALVARAGEPQSSTVGSIVRLDPRFDELVPPDVVIEKLAEGFNWSEGPVWIDDRAMVLFSDVPENVVFKWDAKEGLSRYLSPSGYTGAAGRGGESGSNGLLLGPEGHLVLCQHGDRRMARLEKDGTFTTIVDSYQGKRLNSPNDAVYRSNGDLYFTDPPYGVQRGGVRELDFCGVYRVTPQGEVTLLTNELSRPNGIAFSPDEKLLYVANSDRERAIWMVYEVQTNGTIGEGRVFADVTDEMGKLKGSPDGMKVDVKGNLFVTSPGGVRVYSPDGKLLGRIDTGVPTANCAFAEDGTLYMTADMMLCRVKTNTRGTKPFEVKSVLPK
ncbi:MAG: SMP-30/gluconolactonase/LRE family protein [Planctomycetota bacterium]